MQSSSALFFDFSISVKRAISSEKFSGLINLELLVFMAFAMTAAISSRIFSMFSFMVFFLWTL